MDFCGSGLFIVKMDLEAEGYVVEDCSVSIYGAHAVLFNFFQKIRVPFFF